MFAKINVFNIIKDHFATLVEYAPGTTGRKTPADYALFLVLPLVMALLLGIFKILISPSLINGLMTALSIFAGLLFNLLVLFHGMIKNADRSTTTNSSKLVLKQIYSNISYAILVTLAAIVSLLVCSALEKKTGEIVFSTISYFLVTHFLLTMLMVLKRMHALLSEDFKNHLA